MKKFFVVMSLLTVMMVAASVSFAFDPSLVSHDGLSAKVEASVDQFGMKDGVPVSTLQMYGVGATYGLKGLGTKVSLSAGGAVLNVKDAFEVSDYQDSAPYLSLGVSQQVYQIAGVRLGVFGDITSVFQLSDSFMGTGVEVDNLTLGRLGAIAQYNVMKNLDVYAGMNGQWLNANVKVEGMKEPISNDNKLAGFVGAKYALDAFTFDLNVGAADRLHVGANVSYNF